MFALKSIRIERGLSQQALADLSGVPKRTIQDAERFGETKFSTAVKLARALGCTLDDLWEDDLIDESNAPDIEA